MMFLGRADGSGLKGRAFARYGCFNGYSWTGTNLGKLYYHFTLIFKSNKL